MVHISPTPKICAHCRCDLAPYNPSNHKKRKEEREAPKNLLLIDATWKLINAEESRAQCRQCGLTYSGFWRYRMSQGQVDPSSTYLSCSFGDEDYLTLPQTRQSFGVSVRCLRQLRQMLLTANASIHDIANSISALNDEGGRSVIPCLRAGSNVLRKHIKRLLMAYCVCQVVPKEESESIEWDLRQGGFGKFVEKSLLPRVRTQFERRRVIEHRCAMCKTSVSVVLDGCAKTFRRTCASINGSYINSAPLQSSLSVSCNEWPLRGTLFCAEHQEDCSCLRWKCMGPPFSSFSNSTTGVLPPRFPVSRRPLDTLIWMRRTGDVMRTINALWIKKTP